MKAIILSAGKGENLFPYTSKSQKESINILGKAIIRYSIDGLASAGVKEFIIVVSERGKKDIEEALEGTDYSYELVVQKREGISGAVIDGMERVNDDFVVVAYGDIVAPSEFYKSLINTFISHGSSGVIPLVPVSVAKETYGTVSIKNEKIIIAHDSSLALAGAYVIPKGDFTDIISYLQNLFDKGSLKYYVWSGTWIDVGYPEDIINAIELLLEDVKTSIISENAEVSKTAVIGKKVIIEDGAKVEDYAVIKGPAYIGKNAYIGTYALIREYSSIERNAKIGAYCEIAHSSIQPFAEIGSKSYITYSIIGKNSKVGASVITVSYPSKVIRGRVSKFGSLISPGTQIPHGSVLQPGYKI
ncbi:MAG: NDP-sugar synthase [Sulfolobaceae archaeon]